MLSYAFGSEEAFSEGGAGSTQVKTGHIPTSLYVILHTEAYYDELSTIATNTAQTVLARRLAFSQLIHKFEPSPELIKIATTILSAPEITPDDKIDMARMLIELNARKKITEPLQDVLNDPKASELNIQRAKEILRLT